MENQSVQYSIWAADNAVYGPVELPTLVEWIKDERVLAETWIFDSQNDRWRKAAHLPELQIFFNKKSPAPAGPASAAGDQKITPGMLRRVKALAEMSDEQLDRFVHYMEPQSVRQWSQIVKQGETDDSMYLVLEGELRVRLMITGKETILATLGPGECFGEIALFDRGPRSADVLTNKDSVLLKITSEAFDKLRREAPELAVPMLFAISRTLAGRIRADNKRIKDSVNFARTGGY
ncbi:MAG: cyclic nucleotide-binding domain-containing protein [Verrucomicrobiota bacterium]|jgi:CRP-like cAMP-binding protein